MPEVLLDAIERIDHESCAASSWDRDWSQTWERRASADNWQRHWSNFSF